MNPTVKQKWLDALRDESYIQGEGKLRSHVSWNSSKLGYCCLGVLCDLYDKEHDNSRWNEDNDFCVINDGGEFCVDHFPPMSVHDWAGTEPNENRDIAPSQAEDFFSKRAIYGASTLAEANDAGASFDLIAEFIEKYM